jgi:protein required for attachment to host cells
MVADGAKARLFSYEKIGGPLRAIHWMDHPESRLPGREISSDGSGRVFDSGPGARSALEPSTGIREFEKQRFAREVGALLDAARRKERFERLVLVAPPKALGDLRKTLDHETRKRVVAEIDKNPTDTSTAELRRHLGDHMAV